ncbi:MAG: CehA/McbA family metallohydrolase [Rhodospirillales bacterium]
MKTVSVAVRALLLGWIATAAAFCQPTALKWYKGNLHTHTLNSDGDSSPLDVATWYRENGYHFLVLSDHNYLTEVADLNRVLGAKEKFLLISGEEISDSFDGKPVHVNATDLHEQLQPAGGRSLVETISRNVEAIKAKGALPAVNHPNFRWAMTSRDLLEVPGMTHFEIYNGHPEVHNHGGGGAESLEEMWDVLLTAGRRLYGYAVDDAHVFKRFGRNLSNPGRGWVMVRAAALDTANIVKALREGNFYASTGVELNDIQVTESELRIEIKPARDFKFTTYFIGAQGAVLARSVDLKPVYRFKGNERYMRARVEGSGGDTAWVQPVFLPARP